LRDIGMFRDFFRIAVRSMEQIQYGEPLIGSNSGFDNPVPEHTVDGRTMEMTVRHRDRAVMEDFLHGVSPLRTAAPGANDAKRPAYDEPSHYHKVGVYIDLAIAVSVPYSAVPEGCDNNQ